MVNDWFRHLEDSQWLKSDDTGSDEAQFIMKALCLKAGDRVLDAPCGAGRIAVHLARAGCQVTGIDINPRFIERARRRFADENLSADFVVLDLCALDLHNEFDDIYNWSGSFGYSTDEENIDILRRMAMALKPGGRLLIDQTNRERLLRHFIHEVQLGDAIRRNRWDAAGQRIESALYVDDKEQRGTFSSVRLYTPAQFVHLLTKVGLSLEIMYGWQECSLYTRTSRRMIVVGKKTF